MLFNNLISTDRCRPPGQSDTRAEVFGGWNRLCFWRHPAAGLEPQLLFRPRRYRLARRGLERAGLPTHYPRCGGIGLYRRSGPSVPAAGSRWRWWRTGIVRERTDLVQQKSGRALCHRVAGRFDSAAFCAFGGGRRRFGRRFHPLPAGGGGRRQRQPSAFRLSSADRPAAIRHRRQRSGVLAELRQCGGRAISLRRQQTSWPNGCLLTTTPIWWNATVWAVCSATPMRWGSTPIPLRGQIELEYMMLEKLLVHQTV